MKSFQKLLLPVYIVEESDRSTEVRLHGIRTDADTRGEFEKYFDRSIPEIIGDAERNINREVMEFGTEVRCRGDSKIQIERESVDIEAVQVILDTEIYRTSVPETITDCSDQSKIAHAIFECHTGDRIATAKSDAEPVCPIIRGCGRCRHAQYDNDENQENLLHDIRSFAGVLLEYPFEIDAIYP